MLGTHGEEPDFRRAPALGANCRSWSFSCRSSPVRVRPSRVSHGAAAVRDVGRRHATQLPDALAGELAKLNVGGISSPRVVENGVSMLAVCSKNSARDLTFIKSNLRAQSGNEAMKAEAEKYLAELRSKARIVFN